jgi:hypothetical protein
VERQDHRGCQGNFPIPNEYSFNKSQTPLDKLTIRSLPHMLAQKSQRAPNAIKNWKKKLKEDPFPQSKPNWKRISANFTQILFSLQWITTSTINLLSTGHYTPAQGEATPPNYAVYVGSLKKLYSTSLHALKSKKHSHLSSHTFSKSKDTNL